MSVESNGFKIFGNGTTYSVFQILMVVSVLVYMLSVILFNFDYIGCKSLFESKSLFERVFSPRATNAELQICWY